MVSASRRTRDLGKRGLHRLFRMGQSVGVDVLPRHFYSAIPDLRELGASDTWRQPRSMVGMAGFDAAEQLERLGAWMRPDVQQAVAGRDLQAEAAAENGALGYGWLESVVLHGFVRSVRPRRVVQVGAGVSTAIMLRAAEAESAPIDVLAVDPFPTDYLVGLAARNEIRLDRRPAQAVEIDVLTDLDDGDLLFIDSTHTVKPGSEVNRIILEVLPRLRPGVWVHFHDIWWPYDYPPDLLTSTIFFWNESVLLHAYLADNARVSTQVCLSWLHHTAPDDVRRILPAYRPARSPRGLAADGGGDHFPSATYLRVNP